MSAITQADRKIEQHSLYWRFNRFLERYLPAGLYQRSLLIVVVPIVLMQSIMVGIILDRHWDSVTKVLARSLAREISLVIDLYDRSNKTTQAIENLRAMTNERLRLRLSVERGAALPPPVPVPWLSMVDTRLNRYLDSETGRPFWIDSSSNPNFVEIRVEAEKGTIFRFVADDDRAYAANTNQLLIWMFVSSLVLLAVAIMFLRKQIKPILDLAYAARGFGLGHDVSHFAPRGAAEVRQAAQAFLNMKERIERHVEQRTAMLAGVSHDLRTILTRFKLELAFLGDSTKVKALRGDVEEMQTMLEAYMNFARGAGGEKAEACNIAEMIAGAAKTGTRPHSKIEIDVSEDLVAKVKPNAFRRLIVNLIANAARYGEMVAVVATTKRNRLRITVDDNGPGIPANMREDVFRPFFRLDEARNQDEGGTGLGLAIARDIARSHGGDIMLEESPLGGLRAVVEIPV